MSYIESLVIIISVSLASLKRDLCQILFYL